MTNNPVANAEKFIDRDDGRYRDAVVIVSWLLENQEGGNYSYLGLADDTGIPQTTVREFLVPEVWAWRSYDYLENLKKRNPKAYIYYAANSKSYGETNDGVEGCRINVSKYHYLEFVSSLMDCKMKQASDTDKQIVVPMTEHGAKVDAIDEMKDVPFDFFENGE